MRHIPFLDQIFYEGHYVADLFTIFQKWLFLQDDAEIRKYCVILFKTLLRILDAKCAVGRSRTKCFDQNHLNSDKAISVSSGVGVTSKPYARLLFVMISMMSFETEMLAVLWLLYLIKLYELFLCYSVGHFI